MYLCNISVKLMNGDVVIYKATGFSPEQAKQKAVYKAKAEHRGFIILSSVLNKVLTIAVSSV